MGGIKKDKFDIEFIKRTTSVIEEYDGKFNVTLLVNCLLGLLILPHEYYNKKNYSFLEEDIEKIPEIKNIIVPEKLTFNPTKKKNGEIVPDRKSLKILLNKIRNGIAHQNIEAINQDDNWSGVSIWNCYPLKSNNIDMKIELTSRELKDFALFISNKYIEYVENTE